jgi:toxin ParE1/3/4
VGNDVLSGKADADIENIAESSLRQWGIAQAEEYILGLHETFQMLVEFPDLGRDAGHIRPGYRKTESASHSVFYRKAEEDILIVRVPHQRMDFGRHL